MSCYPEPGNQNSPHGYPPSLVSTAATTTPLPSIAPPHTSWSSAGRKADQTIPLPSFSALPSTRLPTTLPSARLPSALNPGPAHSLPLPSPPPPKQDDDLRPNYPRYIPSINDLLANHPVFQEALRSNLPRFTPGQDSLRPNLHPSHVPGQDALLNHPSQVPGQTDLRPNYPLSNAGELRPHFPPNTNVGQSDLRTNYSRPNGGQDSPKPNYPITTASQEIRPNYPSTTLGQDGVRSNHPNTGQEDLRPNYPIPKAVQDSVQSNYSRPNIGQDDPRPNHPNANTIQDVSRPKNPHPNIGQSKSEDEDLRPNYPRPNAGQNENKDDDLRPNYPKPNAGQNENKDDDLRPNYPKPNAGQNENKDEDLRPNYPRPKAGQIEKADEDLRPNYPRPNTRQSQNKDKDLGPNYPRTNAEENKNEDENLRPNYPRPNAGKDDNDDEEKMEAKEDSEHEEKADEDDEDLRPNYPHPRHFLPVQTEYRPEQYYPPSPITIEPEQNELSRRHAPYQSAPVKTRPFRNPNRKSDGGKRERPFNIAAVLLGCDPKQVPRHGTDETVGKRVNHDLRTKYRAVRMMEQYPDLKQTEIARELGIPSNTVATWWRNKDRIISACESSEFGPKVKKMRKAAFPDVEDAVDGWLKDAKQSDLPITGPVIMKKAEAFAREFGHRDFVCTQGWLARFQNRKNIKLRDLKKGDLPSPENPSFTGIELSFPEPPMKADPDGDAGSDQEGEGEGVGGGGGGVARLEQASMHEMDEETNNTQASSTSSTSTSLASERKRRFVNRKVFDLHTRYKALKTLETNPAMRKGEVAEMYSVPRNTLSTWLKNKDQIIRSYEMAKFSPNAKRMRGANLRDVEEALDGWLRDAIDKDAPISQIILSRKAEELAKSLGHEEFTCTPGWLTRFQGRKNIRLRDIHKRSRSLAEAGESPSMVPHPTAPHHDFALPDAIAHKLYQEMNTLGPQKSREPGEMEGNRPESTSNNTHTPPPPPPPAPHNYHDEIAQLYNLYPRPPDPDPRLNPASNPPNPDTGANNTPGPSDPAQSLHHETLSVIDDVREKLGNKNMDESTENDMDDNDNDQDMDESDVKAEPVEQELQTKPMTPKLRSPRLRPKTRSGVNRCLMTPENLDVTRENALESLAHLRTYLESQSETQLLFPYLANIEKYVQNSAKTDE